MEDQVQNTPPGKEVITMGNWVVTLILLMIPIVGFIMLLVWAFGGGVPESKANYAKASLLIGVIALVIIGIFWGAIGALALGSLM